MREQCGHEFSGGFVVITLLQLGKNVCKDVSYFSRLMLSNALKHRVKSNVFAHYVHASIVVAVFRIAVKHDDADVGAVGENLGYDAIFDNNYNFHVMSFSIR